MAISQFPAVQSVLLADLRAKADPAAPFPCQQSWLKQFRQAIHEMPNLRRVRIAIMGNGTLNLLADTLLFWLGLEGYAAEVYLPSYGVWRQEILESQSAFYAFQPDIVWLLASERDLDFREISPGATTEACHRVVSLVADEWRSYWRQMQSQLQAARIVQSNVEEPSVRTLGHFEAAVPWSRTSLIQALNRTVSEHARLEHIAIFDMHHIAACFGLIRWWDERQWHQSKQPFAPDSFGLVSFQFARLVVSMLGTVRKCVVLDLDNTIWGGVIGDDGVDGIQLGNGAEGEAFVAFQKYLKGLLSRGILLAVCSKNDQAVAEEPFRKHPAMQIRLEDIACFRANWENKAENLRDIADALNIGLDALVFVDDNAGERELVRSQLPDVSVVAMPEDPSDYPAALAAACLFETTSFSIEDAARAQLYRENAQREDSMRAATDLKSFLRGLEMEAECGPVDSFRLPRMAQLLAKTNQFHLTTTRYSEAELASMAGDPRIWMRWFSLRDRIGDHGLISVVILRPEDEALAIDTWAMSCRVFSRGMEEFILLEMLDAARAFGAQRLIGRYRPTDKNHPVAGLYKRLRFAFEANEETGSCWSLDLSKSDVQLAPFIRRTGEIESMVSAVAS
jgi:FkbH-like protein